MKCYVVRHGIAYEADPKRWPDDRDRPLTPEGEERFREVARGLARIASEPDVVLSSPLIRAWRTAEILSEEAGWPDPTVCEALEPERPPAEMAAALLRHARNDAVATVGHEPQLGLLISLLLSGSEAVDIVMKKGAAACVVFDDVVAPDSAALMWLVPPKIARRIRS